MGSITNPSLRIPTIDFPGQFLKPKTPEWESVRAQVIQALEEFGCFEASFDKIPINLRENEIFEATKELFDLPLENKRLHVSSKPFYSYKSYGKSGEDRFPHEAMVIEKPNVNEKAESFTNAMWPEGNPRFCKTIYSYSEQASELDQIIRRMVFESLGIEHRFEEHMETSNYVLRVLKYECPENGVNKMVGLTDHVDKTYFAILSQNEVDGLEIKAKDGRWIPVKPSKGTFVVIPGDVFSFVLTNGRIHCPVHRVIMSGNKPRYSTVLFSNPNVDYLIKTPEELVDEKHPLMFKPFYLFDYVKFFATVGKAHESALHAFCGI